eukprot:TRINITY_DN4665_c0_g1_i1.p1 TRINITY_DN4665_c0_g1~~TRINITY_DN4665_c0_g1_i1.p1  ORF type:complete len:627 (+),score=101.00 TRINITY_DN4665_c0_g1_i1:206-1882(+)
MVGGIITVPLIISNQFNANFTPSEQNYIVSASLIVSGIASLVQVVQIQVPFTNYAIGSGLLSVMGISFTFLPIAESSISVMRANGNTGQEAYGRFLGTLMLCCFLEVALAFAPQKVLKRLFPPVVSGTTVILIGFALVATGIRYWGGGVYCGQQVLTSKPLCNTNGEVQLPFGSRQYLLLGFCTFITLVFVELFGSPFMRNIQVVLGLLVGMIFASSLTYTQCTESCGEPSCTTTCYDILPEGVTYNSSTNTISGKPAGTFVNSTVCQENCGEVTCVEVCKVLRYVTGAEISSAKWITFLWVHTFPIGFYAPAVLPMIFGYVVTTMECIGDVTATTEASGEIPVGDEYERSIQGGVLADGLNCFFAAIGTMLPCTTYAQNNGVISLTRCGARRAGVGCAITLFLLGVIAKFAGIIRSIPDCVLGGMTTFLFINVTISGMKILTLEEGINRRNRFISAMAMSLGIGVTIAPEFINISGQFEYPHEGNFWPIKQSWSSAYRGFRDALIIVLSTGFSIGGFTCVILNLILPRDKDDIDEEGKFHGMPEEKLKEYADGKDEV